MHITTVAQWTDARRRGAYTADSLSSEGFIHCSDPHQVAWVVSQRFRGRDDLVVLHIDASKLMAEIRYENLEGGAELFPHVYGPIPCTAVIDVTPLAPAP